MPKRIETVPTICSRCGNDLLGGKAILNLPHEKRYICFCAVCAKGLDVEHLYAFSKSDVEKDKEFWNEKV